MEQLLATGIAAHPVSQFGLYFACRFLSSVLTAAKFSASGATEISQLRSGWKNRSPILSSPARDAGTPTFRRPIRDGIIFYANTSHFVAG
jgi:hypothetical protein